MPNDPSNPNSTVNRETIAGATGGSPSSTLSSTDTGRGSGQPEFEQVNGKEANEAKPSGEDGDDSGDEESDTKLDAGTSPTGVGFGKGKL